MPGTCFLLPKKRDLVSHLSFHDLERRASGLTIRMLGSQEGAFSFKVELLTNAIRSS